MKTGLKQVAGVWLGVMLVSAAVHGQEVLLWRAVNTNTPTVVPAYAGQGSPFPKKKADKTKSMDIEAEKAREERQAALLKAEEILKSPQALQPQLGGIRFVGRIEGPGGTRVLINNEWVGVGQYIRVKLTQTDLATGAIEELRKYDTDAADNLANMLAARLAGKPYLKLQITQVGKKDVKLQGDGDKFTVPIQVAY